MRPRVVGSLYGIAAALFAAGVVLRLAEAPLPRASSSEAPLPQAPAAAARADAATERSYEQLVTANPFSVTRLPPRLRFAPPGTSPAATARAVPAAPPIRLYGTAVTADGAIALIDADPRIPGAEIYRVGDLVAGARLVEITDSTVVLAEPSGPRILRLAPAERRKP